MNKKLLILCVAAVAVLGGAFYYFTTTPYYSILLLTRAIDKRDPVEALKYVDIDSLSESLAKNLLPPRGDGKAPADHLSKIVSMNMASIKEGLRDYLTSLIRSGELLEAGKKGIPRFPGLDIQELGALTLWRLDVKTHDGTADVAIKGKPGQTAKMVRTGEGYWKFVAVDLGKGKKD